ncbi:protein brambleberry isoform X2 [Amia ocellicauda]|uniref:protein brambleberry isoform X2 n=1 Tax=Amia ocellicauda TaxID=2972642 RepID=UPI003463FF34
MMTAAVGRMLARGLLVWVVCVQVCSVGAFFGWLKKQPPSPSPDPPGSPSGGVLQPVPPFEMNTVDERFLAEAKQLELSPLDSCHYRVIAQLKSTCSSLSEEELAKLGVLLFNCQAEAEGRGTYPCTEEMSIKQCTEEMDPDTWNAYHIVSNRARSVCYATRQQHFRRRAEITVNSLISTATSQLEAMSSLKEGQQELKELTASSVETLLQSQGALLEQQGALQAGQQQLDSSIGANLEQLGQERALISAGQQHVAELIQGITQRMENVSEHLKGQGSELQEGHQAILADLAEVRGHAQDIYKKIDQNLSGFLRYQNRTARFYEDLMGKLQRMNSTLGGLVHFLDSMQGRLEDRLHAIQGYLGWAGCSLAAVSTCVLHGGYLVLCAVLLSFLQTPVFSRAALLVAVPLNALAELQHQPGLDFTGLSLLLLFLSLGHWFLLQLFSSAAALWCRRAATTPSLPPPRALASETDACRLGCLASSTPHRLVSEGGVKQEQDSSVFDDPVLTGLCPSPSDLLGRFLPPFQGTPTHSTPLLKRPAPPGVVLEGLPQRHLGTLLDAVSDSRSASPNQSLASNGSVSGRQLCQGITKAGLQCKKRAQLGHDYCRLHEGGHTSYNNQL